MQTQTFETSKGTLMAIRLPEEATKAEIVGERIMYHHKDGASATGRFLSGDWKEIGIWGSVSEERAELVVESTEYYEPISQQYTVPVFRDYSSDSWTWSALESLQSLLETKIPIRNSKPKPDQCGYMGPCGLSCEWDEWQTSEAEVWKNIYLMYKMK